MLLSLATSLNSTPLPPISDRYGVRLPPPQHTLANINYSVIPNAPPPLDEDAEAEEDAEEEAAAENKARAAQEAQTRGGSIGEEDGEDVRPEGDETALGAQPMAVDEARGTKRALEEDEDYD
jgi:transcription initiation factor TFIID subunit 9B